MNQEAEVQPVTETEVAAFSEKLQRWAAELPPREQAILQGVVAAAAAAKPDDVQGFMRMETDPNRDGGGGAGGGNPLGDTARIVDPMGFVFGDPMPFPKGLENAIRTGLSFLQMGGG